MKAFLGLVRRHRGTSLMLIATVAMFGMAALLGSDPDIKSHRLDQEKAFDAKGLQAKEDLVKKRLEEDPSLAGALSLGFLSLLVAGIVLDILLIRRTWRGRPWIGPAASRAFPTVRWGGKQLFQAAVFTLFSEGCLFIAHVGFYYWTQIELSQDLLLVLTSLGRDLLVAGFIIVVVLQTGGRPKEDLGLRTEGLWPQIRLGVLAYVAVVPLLVAGFALLAAVASVFSYEPEPQNVVQMYLKPEMGPYLIGFTLFVAVLGPVLEELFFRGFIFAGLRGGIGPLKAGLLTAAAFAAFHLNVFAFLPVFVLGLFLCYLYERSGSLVPSISAHVLHNTLMVGLTLGFRTLAS